MNWRKRLIFPYLSYPLINFINLNLPPFAQALAVVWSYANECFFKTASAQPFKRFIFTPTTVGLLGFNDTMLSASNE